jgi:protoporphyrinogen oxidase
MNSEANEARASRRSFLKGSLLVGGGVAALGAGAFGAKIASDYRRVGRQRLRPVPPEEIENRITWHGEVFPSNTKRMFLEGKFGGNPDPERDLEVVIVGGGAGGLTAAYRLRDRDFLLLEALPQLGGNCMYAEWEGIPYSLGGQFLGHPGTSSDPVYALCEELGLQPAEDTSPLVIVFPGNLQLENPFSLSSFLRMPLPWKVKRDMVRFYFVDLPGIDYEGRKEELDRIPFTEFLKEYSTEFQGWYEELAKEFPESASASSYHVIKWHRTSDYMGESPLSLPGGLGRINHELARSIERQAPGRMLTEAFAYRVRHDPEGRVLVTYWHNGERTTVRAKAAIINAEGEVAAKILEDVPPDSRDAMGRMRSFNYPVFHYCFRKPVYNRGYMVGVMNCPEIRAMTAQDWWSRDRGPERPNILSCFRFLPLSEPDLPRDRNGMVRAVAETLGELDLRFPGALEKLEAVQVWVRSRNFGIPYPGYLTEVFPRLGRPYGNVFFANARYLESTSYFPEAVIAGNRAAESLRKRIG